MTPDLNRELDEESMSVGKWEDRYRFLPRRFSWSTILTVVIPIAVLMWIFKLGVDAWFAGS